EIPLCPRSMNIQSKTNFTAVKSPQLCALKPVSLLSWLRQKLSHKIGTSSGKLWSFTSSNSSVSPCCFSCHLGGAEPQRLKRLSVEKGYYCCGLCPSCHYSANKASLSLIASAIVHKRQAKENNQG
ncbi:hypothetical protein GOODEAATRI_013024, partial [Goodea atripinnis]